VAGASDGTITDRLCVPTPAKYGARSGTHSVVRLVVVPLSGGSENREHVPDEGGHQKGYFEPVAQSESVLMVLQPASYTSASPSWLLHPW
jgi:hypothetical protein